MQSLHGKCLRRTKAARVKSDSGNRRLTPLHGCVSLPVLSCLHFCLALAAPSLRHALCSLNIPFLLAFPSLASHPCPSFQRLCRSELDLPSLPLLPFSIAKGLVKVVDVSQK